jgi:hypothetical protein
MTYHYALRTPEVINRIIDQRVQAVGTTPTLLNQKGGRLIVISNTSDKTVYVGYEEVTPEIGIPIMPNTILEVFLGETEKLYAVAESDATIRVLEAV